MKKCIYCNTELIRAELHTSSELTPVIKKEKAFALDFFRSSSDFAPYVCSKCGFIAFFLDIPEIFSDENY
ncbi:MAG: hypothetical protein ACRC1T_18315 [Clostridium chrysemydis]|uniref:hypothetical protein n=1 Tax=Clostridium chrysemydis TaxID=2665504 RepID=UPI003F2D8CA9